MKPFKIKVTAEECREVQEAMHEKGIKNKKLAGGSACFLYFTGERMMWDGLSYEREFNNEKYPEITIQEFREMVNPWKPKEGEFIFGVLNDGDNIPVYFLYEDKNGYYWCKDREEDDEASSWAKIRQIKLVDKPLDPKDYMRMMGSEVNMFGVNNNNKEK